MERREQEGLVNKPAGVQKCKAMQLEVESRMQCNPGENAMQWIFWQAELRATGLLTRLRAAKWMQAARCTFSSIHFQHLHSAQLDNECNATCVSAEEKSG